MEMNKNKTADASPGTSRRDFAKKVAWTAPVLTLMMAASSQPARAHSSYGHEEEYPKKTYGYNYPQMWHSVHRGRRH